MSVTTAPPLPTVRPGVQDRRPVGVMLLGFTVVNFAVVALLSAAFGWPGVLGEPASVALPAFAANQTAIVTGFYLFVLLSVLLVPISIGLYRLAPRVGLMAPTVAAFGILSGAFQLLGWIRWPLTVPALADTYLDPATPESVRTATVATYDLVNGYAGGALGEHLGWLFQAAWGVGIALLLVRAQVVPAWLGVSGAALTVVWAVPFLLGGAVAALGDGVAATVGFTAYSLWFLWVGVLGLLLVRTPR